MRSRPGGSRGWRSSATCIPPRQRHGARWNRYSVGRVVTAGSNDGAKRVRLSPVFHERWKRKRKSIGGMPGRASLRAIRRGSGRESEPDGGAAKQEVRERVAGFLGVTAESVYLFSSGMSAIYTAFRATNRLQPERTACSLGSRTLTRSRSNERWDRASSSCRTATIATLRGYRRCRRQAPLRPSIASSPVIRCSQARTSAPIGDRTAASRPLGGR